VSDAISIRELLEKIDAGAPVLLLDVRNEEEFRAWRVEGRSSVHTLHIPYFEFIEEPDTVRRVPADREVLALCAAGGSSEFVAEMLRGAGVSARNITGGMIAWGEHLQPVPVPLDPVEANRFELWQVNRRGKGCLSYVIVSGADAVVVDPSRKTDAYLQFVEDRHARIRHVFDTHVHADHLSGGPEIARLAGVPYFVASGEGIEMHHQIAAVRDGDEIRLGGDDGVTLVVRILHTPGHTPGSTSFLIGRNHLLTGDTLFVSSVGRPDLGGHVDAWGRMLFRTLRRRMAALPDDTVILPAHYSSVEDIGPDGIVAGTLGHLRRTVPELQIESEDQFVEAMKRAIRPAPEAYARIIEANLGSGSFDEERATEWELGRNECAARAMPGST
jgi:glyoxylase-like metal-dependent hydrolase (beta-lactamase superfamily II)/rhodanese-related sulfurtransferase